MKKYNSQGRVMRTLLSKNRAARNQYFVHPPNPPFVFFLLLLFTLLNCESAKAQLGSYDNYALSLKRYYNAAWTAERAEFLNIQKGKNWNLIPHVGFAFGLPTVNLNTGQIAAYKQRQAETKARLKSIDLKYELILNEELNNMRIEVEKAENELEKLTIYSNANQIKEKIFAIHQEAFNKKEMKPLDYYKEKLIIESSRQEYLLAVRAFRVVVLNIEKLSHYNMPTQVIWYDDNADPATTTNFLEVLPSRLPSYMFTKPEVGKPIISNPLGN